MFVVVVFAHQLDEDGTEKGEYESLDKSNEKLHEVERHWAEYFDEEVTAANQHGLKEVLTHVDVTEKT